MRSQTIYFFGGSLLPIVLQRAGLSPKKIKTYVFQMPKRYTRSYKRRSYTRKRYAVRRSYKGRGRKTYSRRRAPARARLTTGGNYRVHNVQADRWHFKAVYDIDEWGLVQFKSFRPYVSGQICTSGITDTFTDMADIHSGLAPAFVAVLPKDWDTVAYKYRHCYVSSSKVEISLYNDPYASVPLTSPITVSLLPITTPQYTNTTPLDTNAEMVGAQVGVTQRVLMPNVTDGNTWTIARFVRHSKLNTDMQYPESTSHANSISAATPPLYTNASAHCGFYLHISHSQSNAIITGLRIRMRVIKYMTMYEKTNWVPNPITIDPMMEAKIAFNGAIGNGTIKSLQDIEQFAHEIADAKEENDYQLSLRLGRTGTAVAAPKGNLDQTSVC